MSRDVSIGCLIAGMLLATGSLAWPATPVAPDQIDGLAAWYKIESLHKRTRDGDTVKKWKDSSGNGHDLTADEMGLPTIFRTRRVNGRPILELGKQALFYVADPFELDDHTIFLIYDAAAPMRALFSSDTNDRSGIVLRDEDQYDQIQDGLGKSRYTRADPRGRGFTVTALTRESGTLRGYVDGSEVSSSGKNGTHLRVGRLFHLRLTTAVTSDAAGLSVAEMVFFDRFLADDERRSVAAYLGRKYGIELQAPDLSALAEEAFDWSGVDPNVNLAATTDQNLNHESVAMTWKDAGRVEGPFRWDPSLHPSRLYCTADGTRAHLAVDLVLAAAVPGTRLRVAVYKNRENYVDDEGETSPVQVQGENRLTVRFETSLSMDAGDFIEVVTMQVGAAGEVVCRPPSRLLAVQR